MISNKIRFISGGMFFSLLLSSCSDDSTPSSPSSTQETSAVTLAQQAMQAGDEVLARIYLINAINKNNESYDNYEAIYKLIMEGKDQSSERLEELELILVQGFSCVDASRVKDLLTLQQEVRKRLDSIQPGYINSPQPTPEDYNTALSENFKLIQETTDTLQLLDLVTARIHLLDEMEATVQDKANAAELLLAVELIHTMQQHNAKLERIIPLYTTETKNLCDAIAKEPSWHGILPEPVLQNPQFDNYTKRYTQKYDELAARYQSLISPEMRNQQLLLSQIRQGVHQSLLQLTSFSHDRLPDNINNLLKDNVSKMRNQQNIADVLDSLPTILIIEGLQKETKGFIDNGEYKLTPKIEILRECITKMTELSRILPVSQPGYQTLDLAQVEESLSPTQTDEKQLHYLWSELSNFHQPSEWVHSKIISYAEMQKRHEEMRYQCYQDFAMTQLNEAYKFYNNQTPFNDPHAEQLCNFIREIKSSLLNPEIATMYQDILSRCIKELPAEEAAALQLKNALYTKKELKDF